MDGEQFREKLLQIGADYESRRADLLRRLGVTASLENPTEADLHEWAALKYDLRLSDEDADSLTPKEAFALLERRAVELKVRAAPPESEPGAEAIRRLRDEAALTQEDLAGKVPCNVSIIKRAELGKTRLSPDRAKDIAAVLSTELDRTINPADLIGPRAPRKPRKSHQ